LRKVTIKSCLNDKLYQRFSQDETFEAEKHFVMPMGC